VAPAGPPFSGGPAKAGAGCPRRSRMAAASSSLSTRLRMNLADAHADGLVFRNHLVVATCTGSPGFRVGSSRSGGPGGRRSSGGMVMSVITRSNWSGLAGRRFQGFGAAGSAGHAVAELFEQLFFHVDDLRLVIYQQDLARCSAPRCARCLLDFGFNILQRRQVHMEGAAFAGVLSRDETPVVFSRCRGMSDSPETGALAGFLGV